VEDINMKTEITALFDSSYHELLPILEDLMRGGLVEQFIIWESDYGDLDKRYYRATTRGLIWLTRIFDELLPRKGHGRYNHKGERRDLHEN
jgi:DNA-binding PadR family transcriptional regulator